MKLPRSNLWENLQELFMIMVVVLPKWMFLFFLFPDCFSMPLALHTGFSSLWRPSPALNSTLATFGYLLLPGFSVASLSHFTTSATILCVYFISIGVFAIHSFPHYDAFVTQMRAGTPHPWSSSILAVIELPLLASTYFETTNVLVTTLLFYHVD